MAYTKESEQARILRRVLYEIKEKNLLHDIELRIITRKTVNTGKGPLLVEITKDGGTIGRIGRVAILKDKNYRLSKWLENPEESEYSDLEQRVKRLFTAPASVSIYEEIKRAALRSMEAANRLSNMKGGAPCFLYHVITRCEDPIEETKFCNRLLCGGERYGIGGRIGKKSETERPQPKHTTLVAVEETPKREKDPDENAAIQAIEWARQVSEWTGNPSEYVYRRKGRSGEILCGLRSSRVIVTTEGKIIEDKY